MKCSSPLLRIPIFSWEKSSIPPCFKIRDGAIVLSYQPDNLESIRRLLPKPLNDRLQKISCGKCMSCRLNSAEDWALRCALEFKYSECASFLTLTYNDDFLEYANRVNYRERSVSLEPTLRKIHFQLFNKRLREYFSRVLGIDNIRFFACGEYGPSTQRPHYHGIYFNLPFFSDQILYKRCNLNGVKYSLYYSPTLEKLWGKGFCTIGECNWRTICYVSRYTTKKFRSNSEIGLHDQEFRDKILAFFDESDILEDDFLLMSRKPGIGRTFYDFNKDKIYQDDQIITSLPGFGAKVFKPSKYYDRLFDLTDSDKLASIKIQRQRLSFNSDRLKRTNLSEVESIALHNQAAKEKLASFSRLL